MANAATSISNLKILLPSFQVGRTAFVELFGAYPDTKNVFRQFRTADERVLQTGSDLLQHGQGRERERESERERERERYERREMERERERKRER
jgi:hypothetical protein